MTIQSVLEELVNECAGQAVGYLSSKDELDYAVKEATAKLKALMLECLPNKKLTYHIKEILVGGKYINETDGRFNAGYNQALTDITQKVEGL